MSRITRCKMTLHAATPTGGDDDPLVRLSFGAVYSSDKDSEDAVFGKYTPFGNLQVNVVPSAAEHLVVGEKYYVDIHKA